LTLDELATLGGAFSDSDLPFNVDVVDWHSISEAFRDKIGAEWVALFEERRFP
jgi:hypothetical protein